MSQAEQAYLFFLKCPDFSKLISFTVEVDNNVKTKGLSIFHKRILKCRELLFSEMELIATPVFFSKTEIAVVMPKNKFFSSGFQTKLNKMELKLIKTDDVLPVHLQSCLHYTAIAKLAPHWNKVQDLLVQGRDFLMTSDPLRAIKFDIFVDNSEIILSVEPKCIKLPPFRVETYSKLYDISESVISIQESVHVLPSFKKGNAVHLSKKILAKNMFKDYCEMKKHWKNMYGYRLPEIPEESMWYVNVVFNSPFSSSYTYPYFCVRPFGMTEIFRVDPQLTLQSFINDFCKKVHNICQERCQLMDTRASFPSLQLYRIEDIIKDSLPRPGTTYTKIQNTPFRSLPVTQRKSQISGNHSSLFSENKLLTNFENRNKSQANNFNGIGENNNFNKFNDALSKNKVVHPNAGNSDNNNMEHENLLILRKSDSSVSKNTTIPDLQQISKNCFETQPKYAPKFFPKKSIKNKLHPSLNIALQKKQNHITISQNKYAPRFIPNQLKQKSQCTPKLSLNEAKNILQSDDLNSKELILQKSGLKFTPDKNSAIKRKIKTPRMSTQEEFVVKGIGLQDEATKDVRKKPNSKKRMNDGPNSLKESKNKNYKNNNSANSNLSKQ